MARRQRFFGRSRRVVLGHVLAWAAGSAIIAWLVPWGWLFWWLPAWMVQSGLLRWVVASSVAAFMMVLWDKWAGRQHWSRVPENALLAAAALGGSPGTVIGMYVIRHKTSKPAFLRWLWLVLAIQVVLLIWLML